jgi:hypothetical protein
MKFKLYLVAVGALLAFQFPFEAGANSAFSGNKLDDTFPVVSIEGKQATLKGEPKSLKAGDKLYFARSPFEFTVASVSGKQVTVDLPDSHDLAVGNSLVRNLTAVIKKGMDTQKRLNQALE